jgi:hypothetical protein
VSPWGTKNANEIEKLKSTTSSQKKKRSVALCPLCKQTEWLLPGTHYLPQHSVCAGVALVESGRVAFLVLQETGFFTIVTSYTLSASFVIRKRSPISITGDLETLDYIKECEGASHYTTCTELGSTTRSSGESQFRFGRPDRCIICCEVLINILTGVGSVVSSTISSVPVRLFGADIAMQ